MDTYKCADTSYDLVLLGQNILKFKRKEALFIIANVSFLALRSLDFISNLIFRPGSKLLPW